MKKTCRLAAALLILAFLAAPCAGNAWEGGRTNRYYYNQLDADERAIYNALASLRPTNSMDPVRVLVNMPESTTRYGSDDFVNAAWYAYAYDNPEDAAWISFVDANRPDGSDIPFDERRVNASPGLSHYSQLMLVVQPFMTYDELYVIDLMIEGMTDQATAGMSRYDRAAYILQKVSTRLQYDHQHLYDAEIAASPVCIRYGYAICEGFSKIYKIMADKMDLPCVLSGGAAHMCVQVQMEDGNWYIVEPQGSILLGGLDRVKNNSMYYPQSGPAHWKAQEGHGAITMPPIPQYSYSASGNQSPQGYSGNSSQYGSPNNGQTYPSQNTGGAYGLAAYKLSTRTGPSTKYAEGGTYDVKGQYIHVLARAYDSVNEIWWVKCEIPYGGSVRVLWTGYWRFDPTTLSLDQLPVEAW